MANAKNSWTEFGRNIFLWEVQEQNQGLAPAGKDRVAACEAQAKRAHAICDAKFPVSKRQNLSQIDTKAHTFQRGFMNCVHEAQEKAAGCLTQESQARETL